MARRACCVWTGDSWKCPSFEGFGPRACVSTNRASRGFGLGMVRDGVVCPYRRLNIFRHRCPAELRHRTARFSQSRRGTLARARTCVSRAASSINSGVSRRMLAFRLWETALLRLTAATCSYRSLRPMKLAQRTVPSLRLQQKSAAPAPSIRGIVKPCS